MRTGAARLPVMLGLGAGARRVGLGVVAATLALAAWTAAAVEVVVARTGEAALTQPLVEVELRDGRRRTVLFPTLAILDTGASGHVLSVATATLWNLAPDHDARYVETGMTGEHPMGVSVPVDLAVAGTEGGGSVLDDQRLLLNPAAGDLLAGILMPGAAADVVGMPAIEHLVVELGPPGEKVEPVPGALLGVAVRLVSGGRAVAAAHWVPLTLVDYNRRHHPKNRGSLPTLAANPVIEDVTARIGATRATGDWLLDTGSAVSILATGQARRLGLVDAAGRPTRDPTFTLPVSGIGGAPRALPGFRVERLELPLERGGMVVFRDAAVLVHDVTVVRDDGSETVLDGILGMNLLLASGDGLAALTGAAIHPSPFQKVVIDGPRRRLGLTPAR